MRTSLKCVEPAPVLRFMVVEPHRVGILRAGNDGWTEYIEWVRRSHRSTVII